MIQLMYLFNCPKCGVELPYALEEADVAADTEFTRTCDRFTGSPGCGAAITLKPSMGRLIRRMPRPGAMIVS